MNILIVLAHSYIPQYSGGVESSTHELALELVRRGHCVSVLCRLEPSGFTGLTFRSIRRWSGRPYAHSTRLGYPVYRAWNVLDALGAVVADASPDVALVQNWSPVRISNILRTLNVPTMVYLHNVTTELLDGDLRSLKGARFISNSRFTAQRYKTLFGINSVALPPLFHRERYYAPRRPSNITFINPHPQKGVDLAFQIAEKCPEIPFLFVQSWLLGEEEHKFLRKRMQTIRNVTFRRHTRDMRNVYSKAKIVLVPSQCEEAWGRVASEAQFSGIPVVASDIGGLPEAVGPGGILLDPKSSADIWIDAIRKLWLDKVFYREKSDAALAFSRRPEIDPAQQLDCLLTVATRCRLNMAANGASANSPAEKRVDAEAASS